MGLQAVDTKTNTTTTSKNKAPVMKYFFGESGYNITVLDALVATGKVTKENLSKVLKRKDILLSECKGNSLVLSTIAPNGLIKNIGYFSANADRELFAADAEEGYKAIKENNLIIAISNEEFVDSWAA